MLIARGIQIGQAPASGALVTTWWPSEVTSYLASSGGYGVALDMDSDGNTAVVGTNQLTGTGPSTYPEEVYIYVRSGSTWSLQATITPPVAATDTEKFGWSVAISDDGDLVAIGCPRTGLSMDGEVYTYTRSGSTWSHADTITPGGALNEATFGVMVVLSGDGNTLAVGGHRDIASSLELRVTIYTYSGSWSEQQMLDGTHVTGVGDERWGTPWKWGSRGFDLSYDGDILVASDWNDANAATNFPGETKGYVEVWNRSVGTWSRSQKIKNPVDDESRPPYDVGEMDTLFGAAVAIDDTGDWIAVGAPNWHDGGGSARWGAVYIYKWNGSSYDEHQLLETEYTYPDSHSYNMGSYVSLNGTGDVLLVGEPYTSGSQGKLYLFTRIGSTWAQVSTIIQPLSGQWFGWSVEISKDGEYAIVSAPGWQSGTDMGKVYIVKITS